jgi:hypothetical protein
MVTAAALRASARWPEASRRELWQGRLIRHLRCANPCRRIRPIAVAGSGMSGAIIAATISSEMRGFSVWRRAL